MKTKKGLIWKWSLCGAFLQLLFPTFSSATEDLVSNPSSDSLSTDGRQLSCRPVLEAIVKSIGENELKALQDGVANAGGDKEVLIQKSILSRLRRDRVLESEAQYIAYETGLQLAPFFETGIVHQAILAELQTTKMSDSEIRDFLSAFSMLVRHDADKAVRIVDRVVERILNNFDLTFNVEQISQVLSRAKGLGMTALEYERFILSLRRHSETNFESLRVSVFSLMHEASPSFVVKVLQQNSRWRQLWARFKGQTPLYLVTRNRDEDINHEPFANQRIFNTLLLLRHLRSISSLGRELFLLKEAPYLSVHQYEEILADPGISFEDGFRSKLLELRDLYVWSLKEGTDIVQRSVRSLEDEVKEIQNELQELMKKTPDLPDWPNPIVLVDQRLLKGLRKSIGSYEDNDDWFDAMKDLLVEHRAGFRKEDFLDVITSMFERSCSFEAKRTLRVVRTLRTESLFYDLSSEDLEPLRKAMIAKMESYKDFKNQKKLFDLLSSGWGTEGREAVLEEAKNRELRIEELQKTLEGTQERLRVASENEKETRRQVLEKLNAMVESLRVASSP